MENLQKEYKSLAESLMEEREREMEIEETLTAPTTPIIWGKPTGIVKTTTAKLRVRKEPNGEVIKVLNKGDKVVVITEDCGDGWSCLQDGTFVMAKFLEG